MCQIGNKKVNLRKDRIVYKIEEFNGFEWQTPYYYATLEHNKTIEAKGDSVWLHHPNILSTIGKGFFHCFTNKKDTIKTAEILGKRSFRALRVVKTIIPHKDNIVYRGYFAWGEINTMCARFIHITDEIIWQSNKE